MNQFNNPHAGVPGLPLQYQLEQQRLEMLRQQQLLQQQMYQQQMQQQMYQDQIQFNNGQVMYHNQGPAGHRFNNQRQSIQGNVYLQREQQNDGRFNDSPDEVNKEQVMLPATSKAAKGFVIRSIIDPATYNLSFKLSPRTTALEENDFKDLTDESPVMYESLQSILTSASEYMDADTEPKLLTYSNSMIGRFYIKSSLKDNVRTMFSGNTENLYTKLNTTMKAVKNMDDYIVCEHINKMITARVNFIMSIATAAGIIGNITMDSFVTDYSDLLKHAENYTVKTGVKLSEMVAKHMDALLASIREAMSSKFEGKEDSVLVVKPINTIAVRKHTMELGLTTLGSSWVRLEDEPSNDFIRSICYASVDDIDLLVTRNGEGFWLAVNSETKDCYIKRVV